jgi:hypothetical protein
MDAELKAVQEVAAKLKAATSADDTLNAMMGLQETATAEAGAQAAGVDLERYNVIRSQLQEAVQAFAPLEQEGIDTTKMPQNLRDEFRVSRERQIQQLAPMVPAQVQQVLADRAPELRKKSLELVGSRLKGAGV